MSLIVTFAFICIGAAAITAAALPAVRMGSRKLVVMRLAHRLRTLQDEVRTFLVLHDTDLFAQDRLLIGQLAELNGPHIGRSRRLTRSHRDNYQLDTTIKVARQAIERVEDILPTIVDEQVYDFYRRYQQILLDGLEDHLPMSWLSDYLPVSIRLHLVLKSKDRQLADLADWYAYRAPELRAA